MAEIYIRLLLRDRGRIEDAQHDVPISDFGGHVPAVGDRVVEMLRGRSEGFRVVERLFETGAKTPYINLVVERLDITDIEHLPRFAPDR